MVHNKKIKSLTSFAGTQTRRAAAPLCPTCLRPLLESYMLSGSSSIRNSMNLNATFWGQALFILALVVIFLTIKFAKGKADNIGLVAIYAFLLNFLIPPVGWFYCYRWANK